MGWTNSGQILGSNFIPSKQQTKLKKLTKLSFILKIIINMMTPRPCSRTLIENKVLTFDHLKYKK